MKAGLLDRFVRIERATETLDAAGAPSLVWTAIGTVRAQLVGTETEEFLRGAGAASEAVVVFRTRFLSGVVVSDRVIHGGVAHNIKAVQEIGRREGLELRTVTRAAS